MKTILFIAASVCLFCGDSFANAKLSELKKDVANSSTSSKAKGFTLAKRAKPKPKACAGICRDFCKDDEGDVEGACSEEKLCCVVVGD